MDVCFSPLDEAEERIIWERVRRELQFRPSVDRSVTPFRLPSPWTVHDISPVLADERWDCFDRAVRQALAGCLGEDPWCYALDWYHSYFRYDPRRSRKGHDLWAENGQGGDGSCHIGFPGFFPDGDYYFFLQLELKWGYLGHPWRQELWLFGEPVIGALSPALEELGFPVKFSSERP